MSGGRLRILTVVGARPQFIKAAIVSRILRERHDELWVHTGQHYNDEMSDLFFRELCLPKPEYHLGIGSGNHGEQTGRMLAELERVIVKESPDVVLVYGDTNSTLAGALAAAKLHVPVGHVEAGCRSRVRAMPEEINRVIADHLSTLRLCATPSAVENLAAEGITDGVHWVGDVMLDMLRSELPRAEASSDVLRRLGLEPFRYLLATVHRAANTDDPSRLVSVLDALGSLGETVVFPVHPRTRKALSSLRVAPTIRLIEPVGYGDMLVLTRNARLVLTDSGGVQKEAFFVGTVCLTLREETEWNETVTAGWNRLVGVNWDAIRTAAESWRPSGVPDTTPFGDGRSAHKIVEAIEQAGLGK